MKTIEITLYKFNELNETAQAQAIEKNRYFNVDHDWWNCTYDDALNIGIEINGFRLDRSRDIKIKLVKDFNEIIDCIISEHGENCDTFKTAMKYRLERSQLVKEHSNGIDTNIVDEEREDDFDSLADDQEELFKNELGELYWKMLDIEYDYLTSDECIKESLIANEYDFLGTGEIY